MTRDFCKLTFNFLKVTDVDNVDNFVEKVNKSKKVIHKTLLIGLNPINDLQDNLHFTRVGRMCYVNLNLNMTCVMIKGRRIDRGTRGAGEKLLY